MDHFEYVAPCLFGLEKLVADELKAMDAQNVTAENARVLFSGGSDILARANICSRYAERIQIKVGSFQAASFTQLFDGVKNLPWERYIDKKDAFPVKGWSINSTLFSIPDCQSIVKKAIVERLKSKYGVEWFDETGPVYQIGFAILKDSVTLTIDTSGEGLHKRGYRKNANEAPLKETLAAAMANLSRLYHDSTVYDPLCGSGTILIESALLARNIAPGIRRSFAAEKFGFVPQEVWRKERTRAQDLIKNDIEFKAVGFDTDPQSVELTLENARLAGVSGCVSAAVRDVAEFEMQTERGIVITNPPYGERLLDVTSAEELYKIMGVVFKQQRGWRYTIISPHDDFEKLFGRPADKRRKLYNGMIKCQLYMYFK